MAASSWAVGFEAKPLDGLRFGGEFYSIDFKNVLGSLNPSNLSTYVTNANLYTYNVTPGGYADVLATLTNGAALGAQQPSTNISIIVDTRTTNLNAAKVSGIDFHVAYDFDTSFGHFDWGLSGTETTRNFVTSGGVASDELGHGNARFLATESLGWNKGRVSAKVTINYTGKFRDIATNNFGVVEPVSSFTIANLNLGYDFKDSGGPLDGASFRLTVDNVFDAAPQTIRRLNTNNLSYNNFTFGRVIKLGFSKKF